MEKAIIRWTGDPTGFAPFVVWFHDGDMPAHGHMDLRADTAGDAIREAQDRWPRFTFRPVAKADEADADVVAIGE